MKRTRLILSILIVTLLVVSCKNSDKSKLPDSRNKVTDFAPVSSFKSMFLELNASGSEITRFTLGQYTPAAQDTLHCAFLWGVLTTDLQLAVQNKNSHQMREILRQMIGLGPKLALEDIAVKLRDSVEPMLDREDWPILENTLFNMQYSVDQTLFDKEQYEIYSVMALGSWTEATDQIARGIAEAYSAESSRLLLHPETWQSLLDNFLLIKGKQYTASPAFQTALKELRSLVGMMDKPTERFLNEADIETIIGSTSNIKAAFVKTRP